MNNLKMHIALLLGVVFLSSGGVLATSVDGYDPDGKLDVSLACASCGNQSLYYVAELQDAIAAVIKQAIEAAAAARAEAEIKAAAAMARPPSAAASVLMARRDGIAAPTITTRTSGVMVPNGKTFLFADDALVITGIQDGWVGQYCITEYKGACPPGEEWQEATLDKWRGKFQWRFNLPIGNMLVHARAINKSNSEVSKISEPLEFLVSGGGS